MGSGNTIYTLIMFCAEPGHDAFAFNYGVAIGTTTMASGVRLAVGTGVTVSDTSVSATNFYGSLVGNASSANQVKTITASDTNANYYVTFVDSHNGSATNETVYTDDGIYYNPGANKLTTQHAEFTGNVLVSGIATVGTSLSSPTIRTNLIKSSDTNATAITITNNDVTVADDLTVSGNLYVNGNTTQVNTSSITVEDRTIELGVVDGSAPSSSTTWDLGVLFNYYDGSAKKSAVIWEQGDQRFKLGSVVSDGGGTGSTNPQITFTSFAPIEVSELWINNTCTGGASQVIACSGAELVLQNITVDAGTF